MAAWGDRMKRHSADDFDRQWDLAEFRCDEGSGVYEAPSGADSRIAYSDGDKAEDYILRSIQQAKDVSYGSDELMLAAKDWPSHYHLGLGRANILEALDGRGVGFTLIGHLRQRGQRAAPDVGLQVLFGPPVKVPPLIGTLMGNDPLIMSPSVL